MSVVAAGPTRLLVRLLVILLTGLILTPRPVAGAAEEPAPAGVWPLSPVPVVVHGFDPPSQPWLPGHRGIDLRGSVGQSVAAALPGIVTFAGMLAGRGVVVIDHGATRTTYEPVTGTVAVGNLVSAGEQLGFLDLAQSHCLPAACLHLGWIRNHDDVYLDPLGLFGARPVRLLPLSGGPSATPGPAARIPVHDAPPALVRWWRVFA